jgi:hypothetical protein
MKLSCKTLICVLQGGVDFSEFSKRVDEKLCFLLKIT